jgi:hypothetical protein
MANSAPTGARKTLAKIAEIVTQFGNQGLPGLDPALR